MFTPITCAVGTASSDKLRMVNKLLRREERCRNYWRKTWGHTTYACKLSCKFYAGNN
jgi:hypothetical protein